MRRACRARRRLPQPADRARPSRRRLRADGRPRGGEKAGTEIGRQARRRAAGHARHDHRGTAARARPGASSGRRPEAAFERGTAGLRARRARSVDGGGRAQRDGRKRASPRRSRAWSRARSSPRKRSTTNRLFSQIVREMRVPATPLARDGGDGAAAERRVCEFYGVETLDGFGAFSRAEIAAAALALAYVKRTQFEARPALSPPDAARARDEPRNRSRDPRQPRAHANPERRARGLAPGDDRPDRDPCRRAPARRAAGEPADRPGGRQPAARFA